MKSRGTRRVRVQVEEVTPYTPVRAAVETVTDDSTEKSSEMKDNTALSSILPECPEDRVCCKNCQAYRDGKCAALADVNFPDSICPFYKEREQARKERIAAMERLEITGRHDMINKYYRNHVKFDKILANEMVGIPYGFDDDVYGKANKGNQESDGVENTHSAETEATA